MPFTNDSLAKQPIDGPFSQSGHFPKPCAQIKKRNIIKIKLDEARFHFMKKLTKNKQYADGFYTANDNIIEEKESTSHHIASHRIASYH